jgi:hypothetical protein
MKNIKMELDYLGQTKRDDWDCNEWKATLRYGKKQLTTPFYTGMAISEPSEDDILSSLLLDKSCYDNARHFEDFANELGYDTDSRKAEKIYNACGKTSKKLKKFLGDDLPEFKEKYENY